MNVNKLILFFGVSLVLSACGKPSLHPMREDGDDADTFPDRRAINGVVLKSEMYSEERDTSLYYLSFLYDISGERAVYELVMPTGFAKPGDIIVLDEKDKLIRFLDPKDPWIQIENKIENE